MDPRWQVALWLYAAIGLRRKHRVTIPDAIIAATSLVLGATLLTNDEKLAAVSGLSCQSVALRKA
ncbi:MAG: PIN domain-containing protein [Phycisphaerales bacterium]|nr:PIN domain-containing protein [Phycisphaerales bacterium]